MNNINILNIKLSSGLKIVKNEANVFNKKQTNERHML